MKIVLFQKEDNRVLDIIEGVYDHYVDDVGDIFWTGGKIQGLKVPYMVVDDDYVVGEFVGLEALAHLIVQKSDKVNSNVDEACKKGFTSIVTGHTYDTDEHDQNNFTRRMLTLMNDPSKTFVDWKTSDGAIKRHTREEFLAVCDELDQIISSKIGVGWMIKERLKKATSIPELEAISLTVD